MSEGIDAIQSSIFCGFINTFLISPLVTSHLIISHLTIYISPSLYCIVLRLYNI